ncbi:hypothetical protein OIN60_14530 [Paenibacillus sp. P96]|uniref:Uncharacterized protein n=1 Tax=Paenibacillus zeirhizosphaerae TaxID=2987519 RepID=A0ABT9FTG0_9BACL|nr:hypothetical protein [Paenibacillus sp. P96]MDP4097975.1 hypothetical protein [Paenibacillus sp. P96]
MKSASGEENVVPTETQQETGTGETNSTTEQPVNYVYNEPERTYIGLIIGIILILVIVGARIGFSVWAKKNK